MNRSAEKVPERAPDSVQDPNRFRAAALKRGAARSAKLSQSIDEAIKTITQEMRDNGGIYPVNGGAVNIKEVVRRASIDEATVYKKHNVDVKRRITLWLDTLKKKETIGRMRVRRAYEERAEDWRKKYLALEAVHIATSLSNQQLQAENLKLRADAQALLAELGRRPSGSVAVMPPKESR